MTPLTERRICWPDFDATCLEGGCLHCDGHPFRPIAVIKEKAEAMGMTTNRYGNGVVNAMAAFRYGQKHDWNNAESR